MDFWIVFAMVFFRFWEAKVVIFGHFGSPAAPFGGSGLHFDDFWVCCDFGSAPPRINPPVLRPKTSPLPYFWECWILGVFLKLVFIIFFGFWVAGGSILDLILPLFGRPRVPLNVSKT